VLTAERRTEIARLGGLARGRQIRARRAAVVEAAKSKTAWAQEFAQEFHPAPHQTVPVGAQPRREQAPLTRASV